MTAPLPEAFSPMSVTLKLEDEIDLSRGDMLVAPDSPPSRVAAIRSHDGVDARAAAGNRANLFDQTGGATGAGQRSRKFAIASTSIL